mmetsp:Transcript_3503/g.6987  ORF Transcript_3503/g.6987 Transcript_3503/m.6987 type:complete len:196 (-) Transcript_3503:30-617(-)
MAVRGPAHGSTQVPHTVLEQVCPTRRPCIATQDITFPSPTRVSRIAFRNHYTASVTIRATKDREALTRKDRDNLDGWVTILKQAKLMDDPHSEDTSQYWFSFGPDELTGGFGEDAFLAIRIFFYQPSPSWARCGVTSIKVWGVPPPPADPSPQDTGAAIVAQLGKAKSVTANIEALAASCMELRRANAAFGVKLK